MDAIASRIESRCAQTSTLSWHLGRRFTRPGNCNTGLRYNIVRYRHGQLILLFGHRGRGSNHGTRERLSFHTYRIRSLPIRPSGDRDVFEERSEEGIETMYVSQKLLKPVFYAPAY